VAYNVETGYTRVIFNKTNAVIINFRTKNYMKTLYFSNFYVSCLDLGKFSRSRHPGISRSRHRESILFSFPLATLLNLKNATTVSKLQTTNMRNAFFKKKNLNTLDM